MGRKIPGRKHRGVRDPEKQHAVKLNSLKDKINAPPANPDDQIIPKSLQRIIDLKNKTKSGDFKKKPKKQKGENKIGDFQQRKGENDREFLKRVNRVCDNVKKEAAFEKKYGVEIKRNRETGKVESVKKRPKDELELMIQKIKKEKKMKKNAKKSEVVEEKLSKSQKRKLKLQKKKENREINKLDEFKNYKDQVKFGEVAHEPPSLAAPKKAEKSTTHRPGQKELLLKKLINNKGSPETTESIQKSTKKLTNISNKAIDKKGKRKNLPNALRRQLDKQQREIIEAYKNLKSKKYKQN